MQNYCMNVQGRRALVPLLKPFLLARWMRWGTGTASHLLVHVLHGFVLRESRVLLVHVSGAGTRIVTEPDAVLGDLLGLLLVDLTDGENLGVSLLHLHETTDE